MWKNAHSCDRLTSQVSSHQLTSFLASKMPGKGHWDSACQIHIRTRARRKSKWTTGRYSALCRCGCARSRKGTQFHCLKFRLGSASEPTICSHCYDVLNEVTSIIHCEMRLLIYSQTLSTGVPSHELSTLLGKDNVVIWKQFPVMNWAHCHDMVMPWYGNNSQSWTEHIAMIWWYHDMETILSHELSTLSTLPWYGDTMIWKQFSVMNWAHCHDMVIPWYGNNSQSWTEHIAMIWWYHDMETILSHELSTLPWYGDTMIWKQFSVMNWAHCHDMVIPWYGNNSQSWIEHIAGIWWRHDMEKILSHGLSTLPWNGDFMIWKQFLHYWPLWGESNHHQWIPISKVQWCWTYVIFVISLNKPLHRQVTCDVMMFMWHHCNTVIFFLTPLGSYLPPVVSWGHQFLSETAAARHP